MSPTLVERRGNVELYAYGSPGYPGWAIFIWKAGKAEPTIHNGKWKDIWPKYYELVTGKNGS